jgi:hypothetical protein
MVKIIVSGLRRAICCARKSLSRAFGRKQADDRQMLAVDRAEDAGQRDVG